MGLVAPKNKDDEAGIAPLRKAIMRARRIDVFLGMQIWADIEQETASRQERIERDAMRIWTPGSTLDQEEKATQAAFLSGRHSELGFVAGMLDRWRADGHEAAKMLKEIGITI